MKKRRISDKQLIKKLKSERQKLINITIEKRKIAIEKRKLMKIKRELRKLRVETGNDLISKMKRTKISPEKRRKVRRVLSKIGKRLDKIDFNWDNM